MDSRRDFIRKVGGLGLLALGGCRCPTGCVREDAGSLVVLSDGRERLG